MGTKVKGFFKGLKNISNIFDEEKEEPEIQIGMPTDVKHVAHIGADRPAIESPSWMKEFDNESGETPDVKKGTKTHRASRSEELNRDMPKPSGHRHHSSETALDTDSQGRDSSTKPKRARRRRLRRRRSQEKKGDESTGGTQDRPDIPKKRIRCRKRKDDSGSTKSKDSESSNNEQPNL